MPSIEIPERPFNEIIQKFLSSLKVMAACEASVKNGVMGAH